MADGSSAFVRNEYARCSAGVRDVLGDSAVAATVLVVAVASVVAPNPSVDFRAVCFVRAILVTRSQQLGREAERKEGGRGRRGEKGHGARTAPQRTDREERGRRRTQANRGE
jgi:hypothetical protein